MIKQCIVLCNDEGGIIDDLVTYKLNENHYLLIVNAANTNKDYQWIKKHSSNFTVDVSNTSDKYGQLAIQGPHSRALINELVDIDVSHMAMFEFKQNVQIFGKSIIFRSLVILEKMALKFTVSKKILRIYGSNY